MKKQLAVLAAAILSAAACCGEDQLKATDRAQGGDGSMRDTQKAYDWYNTDTLARHLSCLTPDEIRLFQESDLIDVRPVILPYEKYVVTENDYFFWPIATCVEDTIIVMYNRRLSHWGPKRGGENSGVGMIVVSNDKGMTWSDPVDLKSFGTWKAEDAPGNASLGVYKGVVYALMKFGLYKSEDKGKTWQLADEEPKFHDIPGQNRAGLRLTFDDRHGLIAWCAPWEHVKKGRGVKLHYGYDEGYHEGIRAVYSPDFGHNWYSEEQHAPKGHYYNEITPFQHGAAVVFFNRSDHWFGGEKAYAQAFSRTGWFPFTFDFSNVKALSVMDTPDLIFNPVTKRFEIIVDHRYGAGPGPTGKQKMNIYSMGEDELFSGGTEWRYEGTLAQYRDKFGPVDGMNPVGSVIMDAKQYIYVWGGDGKHKAGIFQYTRSLQTDKVREYLVDARKK